MRLSVRHLAHHRSGLCPGASERITYVGELGWNCMSVLSSCRAFTMRSWPRVQPLVSRTRATMR